MADDVFMSYDSQNRANVESLHKELMIRGVTSIWMDKKNLRAGDQWHDEITDAINACSHMIVIITSRALGSKPIRYEYELADQNEKTVIPVIWDDDIAYEDLPPVLYKRETLSRPRQGLETVIAKLMEVLPHLESHLPELNPVEAGEFTMGNKPNPEIKIELPEFWISKTVVSVRDFACFVRSGDIDVKDYWIPGSYELWERGGKNLRWPTGDLLKLAMRRPQQPMRGVTWYEAMAYCGWLSKLRNHPFTLPTDAQWEKAARGLDRRRWANGPDFDPAVSDVENDQIGSEPKDCGIPGSDSPYGCQDMIGQVWNWTRSLVIPDYFQYDNQSLNPKYLEYARWIRGGSWLRRREKARTFHHETQDPLPQEYRYEIGFRLVTEVKPPWLL